MKKRLLSAVLAGSMMLTMLPSTAFAAEETGQEQVDSQEPGTSSGSETTASSVLTAASIVQAPLADHSESNVQDLYDKDSYKVTPPATLDAEGLNTVKVEVTNLKQHTNTDQTVGYWCGFSVVAPEGAKKMKYAFGADANALETWSEVQSLEFNVDGKGNDGIAFYVNAGAETPKTYCAVQFFGEEGTEAVTGVYKFQMDLAGVKTYAEASIGEQKYTTLAEAVEKAEADQTVTLLKDAALTEKLTINKNVTIDGAGFTITGQNASADVYFEIKDCHFSISDATLTDFGGNTPRVTGAGVFKVQPEADAEKTSVTATDLKIKNFNCAAFDIRQGKFTITNCEIDCNNVYEPKEGETNTKLTKGIVAGYNTASDVEGTVTGGSILGANSNFDSWTSNGVEVSYGADVTLDGTTIDSVRGGVSLARNYGPKDKTGSVTLKNCTISTQQPEEDYAVRIFQSNNNATLNEPVSEQDATLKIESGNYKGDIRVSIREDDQVDKASNIVITGGYFTNDPTEFLATGKAAVTSDKDGYNYMVDEAGDNPAEVVVADPEVAQVPADIIGKDKELAEAVHNALSTGAPSVKGDGLTAAAKTVANKNTVTAEDGEDALKDAGVQVEENAKVTIVVQPYMAMKITAANAEASTFTLDITPMYRTIATTNVDNIVLPATDGTTANAVEIGNAQPLTVNKAVTVTIPVPDTIAEAAQNKTLYVTHKSYVYEGKVQSSTSEEVTSYTLTFENPHGFSEFTVSATNGAVAKIDDVSYTTLQAAVDEVAKGQTITLVGKLTAEQMTATVNEPKTFTIALNGNDADLLDIKAGSGYEVTSKPNEAGTMITYTVTGDGPLPPTEEEGGSSGGSGSTTYAVSVNTATNGTVSVSPRNASKGATVTITVTPNEGYVLGTLTATDANGDTISLTNAGNGKYTFTMPSSKVTISATFVAEGSQGTQMPFTDVASGEWYYEAVQYVYDNELMNGMSATTFEPNSTTTRGMIVTMLYRLENEPTAASAGFTDVAAGQWYTDAVNWAAANNIVNGYGDSQFGPTDTITREQMAAILYRYAQYKGYDVTASADLSAYTDAASVSSYAVSAMQWAVGEGLINGVTNTTLVPGGSATRAQVAAILMRFCENVAK